MTCNNGAIKKRQETDGEQMRQGQHNDEQQRQQHNVAKAAT